MDAVTKPRQKRDAEGTKARILAAAEHCFSEVGYAKTGIRDVAARAGVSYPLIGRYYSSKAGLFEAAVERALGLELITAVEPTEFGTHLAKSIVVAIEGRSLGSMLILASADPTARQIATRVVETQVIQPLAEWLGPPGARDRAVAITMLGAGFISHARLMPLIEVNPEAVFEHPTVRWLADSIQRIVAESERYPR